MCTPSQQATVVPTTGTSGVKKRLNAASKRSPDRTVHQYNILVLPRSHQSQPNFVGTHVETHIFTMHVAHMFWQVAQVYGRATGRRVDQNEVHVQSAEAADHVVTQKLKISESRCVMESGGQPCSSLVHPPCPEKPPPTASVRFPPTKFEGLWSRADQIHEVIYGRSGHSFGERRPTSPDQNAHCQIQSAPKKNAAFCVPQVSLFKPCL